MHITQAAQTQRYGCSLPTWLPQPSQTPSSSNSSAESRQPDPPMTSTPQSSQRQPSLTPDEVTCSEKTSPTTPTPPVSVSFKSEPNQSAISKSYSMEELLRSDTMTSRHQKRKQTTPTQKVNKDNAEIEEEVEEDDEAPHEMSKRWPNEDFLGQLSRSTADALTRALSKRSKLDDNGDLKGLVREALESSLESLSHRGAGETTRLIDNPVETGVAASPHAQHHRFPAFVPPSASIMETMGSDGMPPGFGQSFSVYYEAACRVLQNQETLIPTCKAQPQPPLLLQPRSTVKKPELETSSNIPRSSMIMDHGELQTEALSLVVHPKSPHRGRDSPPDQQAHQTQNNLMGGCIPRKKRTKVTDTRLAPPRLSLSPFSFDGNNGTHFAFPDIQRHKIGRDSASRIPPISESLPHLNFENSLVSDFFKNISMNEIHPMALGFPMHRRGPLMTSPGLLLPPFDFLGPLSPHPHRQSHFQHQPPQPPPPPPPPPPHHLERQMPSDLGYDLSKNTMVEPNPIRRNRSIGGKRVTNTTAATFGNGGRGFMTCSSASDDGISGMQALSEAPDRITGTTSTLTPVHLRKAKLMFFFTRYPNSSLLKAFFLDVKFSKNNTAQLVKWFSNFREFYYIQMEKFARVAISEGIRNPNDITVTKNSELYRALALHYNRNNQIEIPVYFRLVVETTLREFFVALSSGKDTEQSWKKPIYKIIARMDQAVPEYFRDPTWMAQLADS